MTLSVPAPHWKGRRGCLMPQDCTMVMKPATMMEALMRYSFTVSSSLLPLRIWAGVMRPMSMAIMCWKPRMAAGMKAIFSSSGKKPGGGRPFAPAPHIQGYGQRGMHRNLVRGRGV